MSADTDDVTTREPEPRGFMCLTASRKVQNTPSMLTANTYRHSCVVMSSKRVAPEPTPALANTESTWPKASTVAANASTTATSSETSTGRARTSPPCEAITLAASSLRDSVLPQIATSAPACASALAIARPMPLLPPVTRATFPVRSNRFSTLLSP